MFALPSALAPNKPLGRVVLLEGQEGTGRTTLALHVAAAYQRAGHGVAWIEAGLRTPFDPQYAAGCGVQVPRLLVQSGRLPSRAHELTKFFLSAGTLGLVVLDDGYAFGNPPRRVEQDAKQLMGELLTNLRGIAKRVGTTLLLVPRDPLLHVARTRADVRVRLWRTATLTAGATDTPVGIACEADVLRAPGGDDIASFHFNVIDRLGIQDERAGG